MFSYFVGVCVASCLETQIRFWVDIQLYMWNGHKNWQCDQDDWGIHQHHWSLSSLTLGLLTNRYEQLHWVCKMSSLLAGKFTLWIILHRATWVKSYQVSVIDLAYLSQKFGYLAFRERSTALGPSIKWPKFSRLSPDLTVCLRMKLWLVLSSGERLSPCYQLVVSQPI